MAGTYSEVGPLSSVFASTPFATTADLPHGIADGSAAVVLADGKIYTYDLDTDTWSVPASGSPYWKDPAASFATLPAGTFVGEARITTDTLTIYVWDGLVWTSEDAAEVPGSRAINTTAPLTGGGNLSADRTIAMAASTDSVDGYLTAADHTTFNNKVSATRSISTSAPLSGGGDLSTNRTLSISQSTTSTDGYLASADFTTFNNKEPAITSGTTSQYWRGDKSFQTLNVAALLAVTDGSLAGSSVIGEVYEAFNALTTTGVGSTGVWGSAFSHSFAAGRYIMMASAELAENGAILTNAVYVGISNSAAPSSVDLGYYSKSPALMASGQSTVLSTPMKVFSFSGATTVYVNTFFTYTSGTPKHAGSLFAMRIG